MSINKDEELNNQSAKKPDSTSKDFELSELETEQVAGGGASGSQPIAGDGNVGCENVLAKCS